MADDRSEAERIDPAEHIDPNDPRYAGFRIREYWALTCIDPDNQEAMIWINNRMAADFHLTPGPAMAADERRLLHLREFGQRAADELGYELRLRHFVPEGEAEVISPS